MFVFVLLFGLFSINASAKNISLSEYSVYTVFQVSSGNAYVRGEHTFTPFNSSVETKTVWFDNFAPSGSVVNYTTTYSITTDDLIVKEPEPTDIIIEKLYYDTNLNYGGSNHLIYKPDNCRALIFYSNGKMQYIDNIAYNYAETIISFTPQTSVDHIEIIFTSKRTNSSGLTASVSGGLGEYTSAGDSGFNVIIKQTPEDTGLLKGIIEWLKGIKDGITNLFNSIAELPAKIWDFISNGLKSLFVPTEDFIVQFKNDMDTMLENKLGAVYQVVNILTDSWDRISANDTSNTINIPSTSIDLPNNNKFTFGGYNVQIVPNGFEWLANAIKTVIGIICTIVFVNGLRKKYDDVMGG